MAALFGRVAKPPKRALLAIIVLRTMLATCPIAQHRFEDASHTGKENALTGLSS